MKKSVTKFLFLIFLLSLVSCVTTKTDPALIDSDCDYLKKILEEASIDVSKTIDEGLDSEQLIYEIKENYNELLKERKPKLVLNENGIDSQRFAVAINNAFKKNLTRPNVHIYIGGDTFRYAPFISNVPYFSELVFEKDGDNYIVYSSAVQGITPGMKYTDDVRNLYKTVVDGKECFRYGIFENHYPGTVYVSVEGKKFDVPVGIYTGPVEQDENLSFKLEDKILKMTFNSCLWHTEQESNRLNDACEAIAKVINEEEVELVVIDMRRNGGGMTAVSYSLAYALCGTTDEQKLLDFNSYLNYFTYGSEYINTLTTRTMNALEGRGTNDLNQTLLANSDSKYVLLNQEYEEEFLKEFTPEFNGRFILITDWGTGSSAETFISVMKNLFKDKVILAGQNTAGCLDYANVHTFVLPDSRLRIMLSQTDFTQTPMLQPESCWHGDSQGFFPDYWFCLTGDFDLMELIDFVNK